MNPATDDRCLVLQPEEGRLDVVAKQMGDDGVVFGDGEEAKAVDVYEQYSDGGSKYLEERRE